MSLGEYKSKRDFNKTTEPDGNEVNALPRPIYLIQRHEASHLHWDLRLEFNGVLKSWAVPKEPAKEPGIKRLAIQTEDHPLPYALFEGEIPEGQYGAGSVSIWDKGTFNLLEKTADKILFDVYGIRLNGVYCLIKTKQAGGRNWLFFRKK